MLSTPLQTDINVSVEVITPAQAKSYLKSNFDTNRKKNSANIARWAIDIKQDRWRLSTDCIAFDSAGRLINGQNRLSAVEKANKPAQFLVARNFPADSIAVLDLGKKRMMHERITIEGISMTAKDCSIIRNAMSRWESGVLGTIYYSQLRHDKIVVDAYLKHKFFLKLMEKSGYIVASIPSFFIVGALMIFLDDLAAKKRSIFLGHDRADIDPLLRSLQFLEIVTTGSLEQLGTFRRDRDGAALLLHQKHQEYKHKRRHWSTFQCFAMTMKLAKKFLSQTNAKYVTEEGIVSPFSKESLSEYGSSNEDLIELVLKANYLTQKVKETTISEIP